MMNLKEFTLDKKKAILAGLIAVIVIYADYSFIIKAQIGKIKNSKFQIVKLGNDLAALNRDLDSMRQGKLKASTSSKPKNFVSEADIPVLLQFISLTANKNEVKIVQLNSAKEKDLLNQGPAKSGALLINLNLSCDYHKFGKFLNALDNSEYYLSVQELKILPDVAQELKQNINLIFKTYVKS